MVTIWTTRGMAAIGGGTMLFGFIAANFSWTLWVPSFALCYFAVRVEADRQYWSRIRAEEARKRFGIGED